MVNSFQYYIHIIHIVQYYIHIVHYIIHIVHYYSYYSLHYYFIHIIHYITLFIGVMIDWNGNLVFGLGLREPILRGRLAMAARMPYCSFGL